MARPAHDNRATYEEPHARYEYRCTRCGLRIEADGAALYMVCIPCKRVLLRWS